MESPNFKSTLFEKINALSKEDKEIFDRIFKVNTVDGKMVIIPSMREWVEKNFGSVQNVEQQEIVKITNLITYEGSVFNDMRSRRPEVKEDRKPIGEVEKCGSEPFCDPLSRTPEDMFGRIKGKFCITASNIAKIDAFHSIIIFKDHNPLDFSAEKIHDYFEVAGEYYKKANSYDKSFVYPFFMWNCLWRAGASLIHGHAQVVLTRDVAYSKVGLLRTRSLWYQENYKSNYFDDLFHIHQKLGLGFEREDIKIITSLCPIKERGITIFAKNFDGSLSFAVNSILRTMVSQHNVKSFNLIALPKPITKTYESWEHMPVILEIVDRGNLESRNSDFGSMELFAQSVVGTNPYQLFDSLAKELSPQ